MGHAAVLVRRRSQGGMASCTSPPLPVAAPDARSPGAAAEPVAARCSHCTSWPAAPVVAPAAVPVPVVVAPAPPVVPVAAERRPLRMGNEVAVAALPVVAVVGVVAVPAAVVVVVPPVPVRRCSQVVSGPTLLA